MCACVCVCVRYTTTQNSTCPYGMVLTGYRSETHHRAYGVNYIFDRHSYRNIMLSAFSEGYAAPKRYKGAELTVRHLRLNASCSNLDVAGCHCAAGLTSWFCLDHVRCKVMAECLGTMP